MSTTTESVELRRRHQAWLQLNAALHDSELAKLLRNLIAVVGLFCLATVVGLALYGITHIDQVYQGVTVGGVAIGGMTESEASEAIDLSFNTYLSQPTSLSFDGESFPIVPSNAGISVDVDSSVSNAMEFGRDGSIWARTRNWARAVLRGEDIPAVLVVDDQRLDATLQRVAPKITQPPANAFIDLSGDGDPSIISEVPGIAFDVGTTERVLLAHVAARSSDPVPVVAPMIEPDIKKEELVTQLVEVQSAVGQSLVLTGDGQQWVVPESDLKRVVNAIKPGEPVQVNRSAIQELVNGIAGQVNRPAVDAALIVNKEGDLEVLPSAMSLDIDVDATVDSISDALKAGTHDVAMTVVQEPPQISDEQAEQARTQASQLVSSGLELTWTDGSARLGADDLLAALTVDAHPGEAQPFALGFSPEVLSQILGNVAEDIDIQPVNGKYRFVDGKVKLEEKGSNGRAVNIDKSTAAIIDAVTGAKGTVELTVEAKKPSVSSSAAKKIKLPDVLGTASTYYGNSSDARRKNIERAVELQTGWLVAPGEKFSYFENIGVVDDKHGFVTGLGILSNGEGGITTAPVIGGGICQVSTTIFQSAFWAGLTIVDRTAHPYWLRNYGEPPSGMKGLDAMVDIEATPDESIDMAFRNNTDSWVAVVMTADGENVVSQILGTNQGWNVSVEGGGPTISNLVDPPTETMYQDSPEFPAGEEKQVESAQQGFDATVVRVTRDKDGNVIDEYTLSSTYVPSVNRILRGTGTGG